MPRLPPKPYPWSFSGMKLFEDCARKFHHLKVLKDYVEPQGEALLYGNEFHKAAELYIRDGVDLPGKFKFAMPVLMQLKNLPGEKHCELKMGLTENLEPCGFFDKDVWWRGAIDLLIVNGDTARVVDYKTGGNTRYADTDQLQLMALAVFKYFPQVTKIKGALAFVVCNAFIKEEYEISRAPGLWAGWMRRYEKLEAAFETGVWNPSPSGLCARFCSVESCSHNGRHK